MVEATILTGDGSPTRYHPRYQQHYHSLSGAHLEARMRYTVAGRVVEAARERGKIRILDVGFGLGTNLAWAIHEIQQEVPGAFIEIVSFDGQNWEENAAQLLHLSSEPFSDPEVD